MVFQTMGAGWLALMMQAERTRKGLPGPAAEWLLRGPGEVEADLEEERLLAAE
ncbi:MAG: hypothetical protein J7521_21860 [Caulobacter sp.]|nr:hypothetical protein [Caulobacter sp.]